MAAMAGNQTLYLHRTSNTSSAKPSNAIAWIASKADRISESYVKSIKGMIWSAFTRINSTNLVIRKGTNCGIFFVDQHSISVKE
jgi:type III secretory pathway lipoprotein EscJ